MPARLDLFDDDTRLRAEVDRNRVTFGGSPGAFSVESVGADRYRVTAPGRDPADVVAIRSGDLVWVQVEGNLFAFRALPAGRHQAATAETDALTSPMPATVVQIAVQVGQAVRRGDLLVSLEAMKMALPVRAPRDGVVTAIHCREGQIVQPDTVLVDL